MAQIRRELHEDLQGVVAGAEAATDWRNYVRRYPWAALAAAVTAGYLLVPRRKRPATEVIAYVPEAARQAEPSRNGTAVPPSKTESTARAGLIGTLFGLVGPLAVRAAQSYASHYIENWIAQQQAGVFGPPPQRGGSDLPPTGAPRAGQRPGSPET